MAALLTSGARAPLPFMPYLEEVWLPIIRIFYFHRFGQTPASLSPPPEIVSVTHLGDKYVIWKSTI